MSIAELESQSYQDQDGPGPDRLPPQDVQAEQSVIGGMLMSKDAISDCVEVLRSTDFYRPAHELIYDAILDLYGRGEPVDAITTADELTKRGDLARVGGQAYLHQLMGSVPTAANAGYYAQIVAERAVLRRLVDAGTRIVQMGFGQGGGDVEDIVNAAQAEVYAVAEKRGGEDYAPIGDIIEATVDEIEHAQGSGGEMIGVPTGFTDLDALTNGLHPGQMIVVAARPAVGKSTLGLDVARAAAIKNHMATAVFSLEMSRTEITMRLLSAEAQIQLQHMRKGTMRDEDWTRLARTMGEVSDAPLFIDDSPNMSLMEIRSKCRRLKQKNNLKLVIIDYLQLMTSGKKVESRQQEVAEFSRALKLLAKELEVPVIAISQLNRGSEQRTDKRPQMSDLRESGCLTADARILRADTGAETTLGELHATGEKDVPIWALDDSLRYVRRHMTHVFPTGTKPVFRLTLASGKTVRATENHPFLAYNGWTALGDLRTGDRIAVPRHVPAPEAFRPWEDAEVALLAHHLSGMTSAPGGDSVVGEWLAGLGLSGSAPAHRCVPATFFHASKRHIAVLLRSLWLSDGGASVDLDAHGGQVWISSLSRRLLDDVARLLLRFGISARLVERQRHDGVAFVLEIRDVDDQRRFLQEIDGPQSRNATAAELLAIVRRQTAARSAAATGLDVHLWERVQDAMALSRDGSEEPSPRLDRNSAEPLGRVAQVLTEADIDLDAVNDVRWEQVTAVELDGVEEVYDATVLGTHNFIANGIAVHNSIEQDADMVILIHREAMYEKESAREGEADLIVAKHRNGPTDTIVVAFQGHYSRFTNMATNF